MKLWMTVIALAALVACDDKESSQPTAASAGVGGVTASSSGTGGPAASASGGTTQTSAGGSAFDACKLCTAASIKGSLAHPELKEISGISASAVHEGIFYANNDSGDSPRLFALDLAGSDRGVITVAGASAEDWEAIATGPCPQGSCVYVGDVGDNLERRSNYVVYRIAEPAAIGGAQTAEAEALPFAYPDGSHNCETLLAHPVSGDLYLVTKVKSGPSGVYRFPTPLTPGKSATLEKVASFEPPIGTTLFTAGDIHPKGYGILMRSYTNVLYYPLKGDDVAAALSAPPCIATGAIEFQGEAIAWTRAGDGYVTASEGNASKMNFIGCSP